MSGTPTARSLLDYYAAPAPMTSAGAHARRLTRLPRDPDALAALVQGLFLHEHFAGPAYGVELSNARRGESQLRNVERMLDRLFTRRDAPLSFARPTSQRVVGVRCGARRGGAGSWSTRSSTTWSGSSWGSTSIRSTSRATAS